VHIGRKVLYYLRSDVFVMLFIGPANIKQERLFFIEFGMKFGLVVYIGVRRNVAKWRALGRMEKV
jgi:hypothetical protein